MKPTLHILTGPTAVGKTEWALRWAEKNRAEIVSCDSLLFYRGMDIGTAKPMRDELARVPHHLIDVCEVTHRMDVTEYITRARAAIDDIVGRGHRVLVTGGSGFYLKSFLAPVADAVEVPDAIRAEVACRSPEQALARLKSLNPGGLGLLDVANPRRVSRALERCLASGRTLADLSAAFAALESPFSTYAIALTILQRDAAELDARCTRRIVGMLARGLVAEVRGLRAAGLEQNPSAAKAIGYREVLAMLDGHMPEAQLAGEILKNTHALVKKQRTWFRTQFPACRVIAAAALQSDDELFSAA